jgi:hypothetical protein
MGRHSTDPIPLRDLLHDSGPMKRIRGESGETVELPAVSPHEMKRRTWPVALILSACIAGAVGIPLGLSSASSPDVTFQPPPSVSALLSASPDPRPTAEGKRKKPSKPGPTKTVYRASAPKPGPTKTITVYRTTVPSPGSTVYVTSAPKPGPTVTKWLPRPTVTITEYETRCYRIRQLSQVEITCPS